MIHFSPAKKLSPLVEFSPVSKQEAPAFHPDVRVQPDQKLDHRDGGGRRPVVRRDGVQQRRRRSKRSTLVRSQSDDLELQRQRWKKLRCNEWHGAFLE
jgi:hypothetical protein